MPSRSTAGSGSRRERLAQEVHAALPRLPRGVGVVRAEPVGLVEERVTGALVVVKGHLDAGVAQLGLQRLGFVVLDEFVGRAEVALHRAFDG